MDLIFLGTGTSDGIPVIGCSCQTCLSHDPRDKRTRSSVFIQEGGLNILIDASIDMRFQFLREGLFDIDIILLTHHHADHIYGLDDIRPINQRLGKKILCLGNSRTCVDIKKRFPYFFDCEQKGGGIPQIEIREIHESVYFGKEKTVCITPVDVFHGKIQITGYRIGQMAYITDASFIPERSYDFLQGLDVLVINALRKRPHETHFSFNEALHEAEKIKARRTFLTHMCHDLRHEDLLSMCQKKAVEPAYDGLKLLIS